MADLVLISPPAAEPVSVEDMLTQLGLPTYTDPTLAEGVASQLLGYISTARQDCENYCRRVFMTQTWLYKLDVWPHRDFRYAARDSEILVPKQPFQSVEFLKYVDTSGTLQDLAVDNSYGNSAAQYGYQVVPGSDMQPARVMPPWAKPWPPSRRVPAAILLQFKAGYGSAVKASMTNGSAVLTGPKFNPGDVGQSVSVPGAGGTGIALVSTIASVDSAGQATLASNALATVANASAYVGADVPAPILQAIKFQAAFYWQQGAVVDQPMPRVVRALLDPYRNLVS